MACISLARRATFSTSRRLLAVGHSQAANRELFGDLARLHGHEYVLDVFYTGEPEDEGGMIVNVEALKPVLRNALSHIDGKVLPEEVAYFQERTATIENLVQFIWNQLPSTMERGWLSRLQLRQSDHLWVDQMSTDRPGCVRLTRRYEFAAAHRLHAPRFSDAQNADFYGKCNNPHGHGHNFGLEITIEGSPHPETGLLVAPSQLDAVVEDEVMARYDHKHLNVDCPDFAEVVPTCENLAQAIFQRLDQRLSGPRHRLVRVGLQETQKNYFEVVA